MIMNSYQTLLTQVTQKDIQVSSARNIDAWTLSIVRCIRGKWLQWLTRSVNRALRTQRQYLRNRGINQCSRVSRSDQMARDKENHWGLPYLASKMMTLSSYARDTQNKAVVMKKATTINWVILRKRRAPNSKCTNYSSMQRKGRQISWETLRNRWNDGRKTNLSSTSSSWWMTSSILNSCEIKNCLMRLTSRTKQVWNSYIFTFSILS